MKKLMFIFLAMFFVFGMYVSQVMAASYTYGEGIPESSVYFTEPNTTKWITGIEVAPGEEFTFDVWISDVPTGQDGLKIWFLKVWVGDKLESGDLAEYVTFEPLDGFDAMHMEPETPSYYGPGWTGIPKSFPGPEGNVPLLRLTYKSRGSGTTTISPASYYEGLYADFQMCDGSDLLDIGYQGMNLVVGEGPPVAEDQSVETDKNQPEDITLKATDPNNDPLTYIITSLPSNGSLKEGGTEIASVPYSLSGDTVTYTPNTDYIGSDSFTFKANDGEFDSNEATVNIEVEEPGANRPPVAEDQSVKTYENTSKDITLKATDPDNDPLTYIITSLPSNGSLKEGGTEITSVPYSLSGDTVTYTPNTDYTGSDSFKFKANDGEFDSNEATVSIEVGKPGPNKPPVAYDQFKYTTKNKPKDITLEAIDPDGDPLTYSIVDDPSHGTLSNFDADAGTVTYTPNTGYTGRDSFTFKANDGKEDSNEATVSIEVSEEEGHQSITTRPSRINPTPGQEFTFSVMYDASDNALTGTGFYVHYSSRYLEFLKVSNVLEEGYLLPDNPEVEDDIEDYDNDPSTDKRFVVCWADPIPPPSWPGVNLPLKLMDVTFRVKEEPLIDTFINFSAHKSTPIGYDFESQPLELCDVDIKANGQDGPITLSHSDTLTISLSLDNNGRTDNADFWLAVDTSFGVFFYILDEGWTDAWVPGYQGPLCYLDSYKVIRDMELLWIRAGKYTFYFGVDTVMDGDITWDKAVYDVVEVNISSE